MTANATHIPSAVGGIPTDVDFVPSVVFAICYFVSLFPFVKRLFDPDTRAWFTLTSLAFSIEHVVVHSLRAAISKKHHPGEDIGGVLAYLQISYAVGIISLATDTVLLARILFVNATLQDPKRGSPDKLALRNKIRARLEGVNLIWSVLVCACASVAWGMYEGAAGHSQAYSNTIYALRSAWVVHERLLCELTMSASTDTSALQWRL